MRNALPRIYPIVALGIAVAGVLVWLALGRGSSDRPAPAQHASEPHDHAPAPREPAPALPHAPSDHGHEHGDTGHQDDLAGALDDELADTTAELPAPPSEDDIATRPEPQPLTPEDQRAQRQASIDLLDRNIERLEAEQKAAEASGDTRTAERNRVRVARMRERRAALAAEPARP
jgi:hypothetical protein